MLHCIFSICFKPETPAAASLWAVQKCKNRHLQKQLLHQNRFRLEQPHRRSNVCKVGGGISIPHLDSTLSALPVFPSTFIPGHGPSRRNYQDQDQEASENSFRSRYEQQHSGSFVADLADYPEGPTGHS